MRPRSAGPVGVDREHRVPGGGELGRPCPSTSTSPVATCTNTRSSPYSAAGTSGSSAIGRMPRPCLPVDSATSCSAHSPNDSSGVVDDEGELVAAPQRQLAERDAELAGPGCPRSRRQASIASCAVAQHGADVVAGDRGRDEPEVGQHGVAPADVRVVLEHAAEAVLGAELRERRARVGDGDVVRAVALQRVEVLELRHRLDRAAGLRGDDEQRRGEVERVAHGADLVRVRGVEHVQADRARRRTSGGSTSGPRLEPPMPSSTASVMPASRTSARERAQVVGLGRQPLGDVQPAEPVGQLGRALGRPQRAVALPDAADDVLVGGGLQPLGDRRLEAGGQLALDAHGALALPAFYCTKASGVSHVRPRAPQVGPTSRCKGPLSAAVWLAMHLTAHSSPPPSPPPSSRTTPRRARIHRSRGRSRLRGRRRGASRILVPRGRIASPSAH